METKFQTSFIPKKPLISDSRIPIARGGTNILMIIASILFIISIVGAVFSVLWINILNKDQKNYKDELAKMQDKFPIADIENLKAINKKIELSKKLLKNHMAVEEIFSIIGQLTSENVRFTSFTFTPPTKDADGVNITLNGIAKNYYSIAFQSDVFGQSSKFGTNKILKNPIVSSVSEQLNGTVNFGFNAVINPEDIRYYKIMKERGEIIDNSTSTTE